MTSGNDYRKDFSILFGGTTSVIAIVSWLLVIAVTVTSLWQYHKMPMLSASLSDTESTESTETLAMTYTLEEDQDVLSFSPHCVDSTDPDNLISSTHINVDGNTLDSISSYTAADTITFNKGTDYTDVNGIVTFRGNNFRNSPTYGTADFSENSLTEVWTLSTGSREYNGKCWTGSGWTGQPLVMEWPKEVRAHMNMYDWAKEKEDLTEVIYACLDGCIYFFDLETGEKTRDTMNVGWVFKGAGSLDPRGYPIMYVGAGYDSDSGRGRIFIINLLDCSIMETFGNSDSFALRDLCFFDSSPLVDAETDTLIYPGENGIIYLVHLNTRYDASAGTLSIEPEYTKWNYYGTRSSKSSYWIGMEDSACVYEGYLYIADNGGNLMCLDLNTLQLVWVQDTLDDTNCSPVLSVEDGKLYLYISTSFHQGWRANVQADIPIFKIDAETGEIVWKTVYQCYTEEGVSGGVQSTAALGRNSLSDYVYVTVSRTGDDAYAYKGVLTCLKKETGEVVWEFSSVYAWSSPICVYDSQGNGRVLFASGGGTLFMLDGLTGEEYDEMSISEGVIESSPICYNDMIVIGTRAEQIYGIRID